jgi:hypothetical protein
LEEETEAEESAQDKALKEFKQMLKNMVRSMCQNGASVDNPLHRDTIHGKLKIFVPVF